MMTNTSESHGDIREAIRALCAEFPAEYHRRIDEERAYPEEFVDALTRNGWMAALIPEEFGGSGLGLAEAAVIMEEINRAGGNSGACHGQMYNMNTLVRHGSEAQRRLYLPKIGDLRDCLVVVDTANYYSGEGEEKTLVRTYVRTFWLARGLGLVKETLRVLNPDKSVRFQTEATLTKFQEP